MSLKLTLKFSDADLNAILKAATFGDSKPHTVKSLKKAKLYDAFVKEMKVTRTSFVDEIVDGSREACANDWLNRFDRGE